jgi:energy-coupling factor transporter transmembrane protein EcfT
MPALIYAVYATAHVVIDLYRGLYNTAFIQMLIGILFTLTLNMLCFKGLTAMSWVIVSIPFILMSAVAGILLFAFGLNPATGKAVYKVAPEAAPTGPPMVQQPLPPKQAPAQESTEPAPPAQPSPYSMPLTVRVESFVDRPMMSNRA